MHRKYALILLAAAFLGASVLLGCEREGPAEKAGEKIDNAVETVQKKADEVGDKITGEGPAEQAGEKIDDAVESAKEAVKQD